MTQEKRDFLVELLKVIFRRMEYCDAGHEWIMSPEGEEEEEEIAFAAMRKVSEAALSFFLPFPFCFRCRFRFLPVLHVLLSFLVSCSSFC